MATKIQKAFTMQVPAMGKLDLGLPIERRLMGLFFMLFWALQFIGVDYLQSIKVLYRGGLVDRFVNIGLFFAPILICFVLWTKDGPEKILAAVFSLGKVLRKKE